MLSTVWVVCAAYTVLHLRSQHFYRKIQQRRNLLLTPPKDVRSGVLFASLVPPHSH